MGPTHGQQAADILARIADGMDRGLSDPYREEWLTMAHTHALLAIAAAINEWEPSP